MTTPLCARAVRAVRAAACAVRAAAALAIVATASGAAIAPARAHHGWAWTAAEAFTLEGTIVSATLGNPHGVVMVTTADGETWTAEIGQPWRNDRAGLTQEMLSPGAAITLEGHRSADPNELRMKAERVIIDGQTHDLYPGRD